MTTLPRVHPTSPALRRLPAALLLCLAVATGTVHAQGTPAPGSSSPAALNFVGADMESVIKAVGHYTGITFIVDPRVKGSLTVVSEKPVTKSQAFALLTSALRLQGYSVVMGDGFAKVVPEADAKLQSAPTQVGMGAPGAQGDQIATRIYHLQYESAANLLAVLRPLISPNNTINANPGNNSLVITDYADNLKRLTRIIAALDAPVAADVEVIPLKNAIASDLAPMITRLMEPGGQGGDSGKVSVLPDPRTNSLVLRAPTPARANLARALVAKLDQPTSEAGNVHVVYLKNADATRLAQTLRAVVSGDVSALPQQQSGTAGGSVGSAGTALGSAPNSFGMQGQGQSGMNTFSAQQPQSQPTGGSSAGFIQADASTNTLIITAPDSVYRNLRGVIDMLDVRRAQVYIESLIVEVTSKRASEFGVQWLGLSGDDQSKYRVGAAQVFNASPGHGLVELATRKVPGPGLAIGVFRQINGELGLGALAHALETDGNANILSTPTMLTLDNELSIIKVGQNVPIISGQFTTTGGAASNPFQTIDRRDVGLTMKIRPQISEGGTIKMAIYHETSSVDKSSVNNEAGVTTNIRVIENNVIADDGQIIVLGGLIEDTEGDGVEKVRGLGDIPVLGNLFKYQTRERRKTNLMIFLRPVIVRSREHSNSLAADRYDYMRATGQQAADAQDDTILLRDLGTPVLPELSNGQPQPGGAMVPARPLPPQAQAGKPAGTVTK